MYSIGRLVIFSDFLETGTLTFWCLPHIVVDIVKTTVHPAWCDPCNYSLPHLRAERPKNREIKIQPGLQNLERYAWQSMWRSRSQTHILGILSGFLILNSAQIELSKASGTVSNEWTVVSVDLRFLPPPPPTPSNERCSFQGRQKKKFATTPKVDLFLSVGLRERCNRLHLFFFKPISRTL